MAQILFYILIPDCTAVFARVGGSQVTAGIFFSPYSLVAAESSSARLGSDNFMSHLGQLVFDRIGDVAFEADGTSPDNFASRWL